MRRVLGVLFRPDRTLRALQDEPLPVGWLYRRWIAPLAAIGPICSAIGLLLIGPGIAGIPLRASPETTLAASLLAYLLTLGGVWLLAFVIAGLAPLFGGIGDRREALKLVAFAGAPLWLAGLFAVYPTLGLAMGLLGALDSLFVLYLGLPRLMRVGERQALLFFLLILGAVIALAVLLRVATALIP